MQSRSAFARRLPDNAQRALARKLVHGVSEEAQDGLAVDLEMATMERSLRHLRHLGFAPRRVVDVGACSGTWTELVRRVFPSTSVLMVEAREAEAPRLSAVAARSSGAISYKIALLGRAPQAGVDFITTAGGTGSSVFAEISTVARAVQRIPMMTLDDVAAGFVDRNARMLLKLDVQGYELEVLAGGAHTLAAAEVVVLETQVWAYNEGAPTQEDVIRFMREHGFHLYDVCGLGRLPPTYHLINADLLFISEWSEIIADRGRMPTDIASSGQ